MYGVQTGSIKTKSQLDSMSQHRSSTGRTATDSQTRSSIGGGTAQSSSIALKTQAASSTVSNQIHVKNVS